MTDVTSTALPVAILIAALAGLVSFASPCVLPLVPGFLGYVTGLAGRPVAAPSQGASANDLDSASGTGRSAAGPSQGASANDPDSASGTGRSPAGPSQGASANNPQPPTPPPSLADQPRARVVLGAVLFVVGFSAVFLVGALAAGAAGAALKQHAGLLTRLGGVVVAALALVFLGVGGRVTQGELHTRWRPATGLAGAPLLGAVFAVGWTPCSGPTLGAILAMSASLAGDAPVARAAALAAAYSLGLGLPFVALAAGWSRAARASTWVRRHQRGVQRAGGGLLLVVGVLMATGMWEGMMSWVQARLITSFVTPL